MIVFKKLSDSILRPYQQANFFTQKRASALMVFSLCLCGLMILIFMAFMLLIPEMLLQAGGPIIAIFLLGSISLLVLKRGSYYGAAHMISLIASVLIIAAFMIKLKRDVHTGYTTYIYFMLAAIVHAILFCKRWVVLVVSLGFLAADVIYFMLAKDMVDGKILQLTKVGFVDSSVSIVMAFLIGMAIIKINNETIKKTEEESLHSRENFNRAQQLVSSLGEASRELAASSEELARTASSFSGNTQSQAASAEEITATVEEVSAGVANVTAGTRDQYRRMSDLQEKIRLLSDAIAQMSETIARSLKTTGEIAKLVGQGEESLSAMSASMEKIILSSSQVKGIVDIINDISDRINLLALNASIEAARAGEAGRGFAVVADEVSKLADQTSSSIKEISSHIMVSSDEIGRGKANVDTTVSIMSKIIEGTSSISTMIEDLAHKMEQQQSVNNQVNMNAQAVIEWSDEIRAAMEGQQSAIIEISRSIGNVNEITQSNSREADRLFSHAQMVEQLAGNMKKTLGS